MSGIFNKIIAFFPLTLVIGLSSAFAKTAPATQPATPEATGSVTVKVVDNGNNSVPGVRVSFFSADNSTKDKAKPADHKKDKTKPQPKSHAKHPQAIAEGRTDGNGELAITVPSGKYTISITEAGDNSGLAHVTVEAGKSTTVTINLTPQQKHGKEK